MHNSIYLNLALVMLILQTGSAYGANSQKMIPETHALHVRGDVSYRCYAGYDGKKVFDEKTKEPCDNKTYKSIVVDKVIQLKIENEVGPYDSMGLAGSWDEKFEFRKRKFEIAITLFKSDSPRPYKIRIVATDDEPSPRETAIFSDMRSVKEMNPISVEYSSAGKKEEITFSATVDAEAMSKK